MTACLRALRRHRGRRLTPRAFGAIPGYAVVGREDPTTRALLAWFPARAVEALIDLGMVNAEGSMTRRGLFTIEGGSE